MTQLVPNLTHWKQMRSRFKEIILISGSDDQVKKRKFKYWDEPIKDKVKRDAIFWYESGEMAGVLLKCVIPEFVQRHTFNTLHAMKWKPPKRKETIPAIKLQGDGTAGELMLGYSAGVIEWASSHKSQQIYVKHMEPMLSAMDKIFRAVLPEYHQMQNTPLPERKRQLEAVEKKGKHPQLGGIPSRYRLFMTSFSSIALLKNCPTACHKDQNGRRDETNFSCLTTVGKYKGGGFAFPEYGLRVPVEPGDLLIAQTSKEWHTNLGRVTGDKFSIVAYWKTRLANPRVAIGPSVPDEDDGDKEVDDNLSGLQDELDKHLGTDWRKPKLR